MPITINCTIYSTRDGQSSRIFLLEYFKSIIPFIALSITIQGYDGMDLFVLIVLKRQPVPAVWQFTVQVKNQTHDKE